jgi:hypothetical protein
MAVEVVVALILSVLAGLGHFVKDTHIKKCKCFCINSDCIEGGDLDKKVIALEQQIEKKTNQLNSLKKRKSESNIPTPEPSVSIPNEVFIEDTASV